MKDDFRSLIFVVLFCVSVGITCFTVAPIIGYYEKTWWHYWGFELK